jgi:cytochrome c551
MFKKTMIGIVLGSSLMLVACGGNNASNDSNGNDSNGNDSANAGNGPKKIFQNKCSTCHGENLQGDFGPALNKIGSQLSKEQILSTIKNGKGQMPAGVIKGSDAEKVAQWLSEKK